MNIGGIAINQVHNYNYAIGNYLVLYYIERCDQFNWRCQDTHTCIPNSNRCNGEVDCNDGSDELNCGNQ